MTNSFLILTTINILNNQNLFIHRRDIIYSSINNLTEYLYSIPLTNENVIQMNRLSYLIDEFEIQHRLISDIIISNQNQIDFLIQLINSNI